MPGPVTFGRKRPLPSCPNPLFLKWLTEWRDSAAEKGLKTQFVYQKAISSLKKYPLPLQNGKEAKILQNFGDGICKMLDQRLEKHYAEHGPNAPIHSLPSSHDKNKSQQRTSSPPPTSSALEGDLRNNPRDGPSPTKKKKTDGKKQREYVPQKRSGGYAVLLTLYKESKNPNSKGYMTKTELQREAQPLCDKSFTLTDPSSKYTAWSSVSTLIQKELVMKTHSPARYSLTDKGLQLAQRLEAALEELDSASHGGTTPSEEDQEDQEKQHCREKTQNVLPPSHKTVTLPFSSVTNRQPREEPVPSCYNHVPDFTLRPGQFNVILCVDFIETTGGAAHRKQELVSELKRNGVHFDVRKLHIGDFLWIAQEKVQPLPGQLRIPQARELVLDYVIERKRMDDLCGSIIDGRFREQKFRLKRCGLSHPIYLVEDYGSAQHLSIPESTLQQAIVNTQNKTLLSCTKEEAGKCNRVFHQDDPSCILIEFKDFNEGAMKNKAQTIKEVFARQLMQISGVSGEKAAAILDRYSTPASLLSAYESCTSTEEKEKLLSNVKCGKLQRNLGPVMSKTIAQLYCTKEALS
ncbi:crossover junction endonuclease MUS81 isoform 2-T6 [Leptodactylus fuscus]|uniref:structure-specific endonuclease subunit MUS81 isoform X2 n=1 Tax=Leptodactylus fuscus TaxID=238119 RepID=UPI003F4F2CB9